jgi:hypothetical protein
MGLHLKLLREHSERLVQRMDSDTTADTRLVMDAAAALEVREFDLFVLAYQRRFERDPLPDRIEDVFAHYMFRQDVPAYVRQFAREVVTRARTGALDPAAFGVAAKPAARPDPRGPLLFWGTLGLTACFCLLLIATPSDAGRDGRLFCDRGAGSAFVGTIARSMTERPDPFGCRR